MNTPPLMGPNARIALGVLLQVCLLIFPILGGITFYYSHKYYFSKATVDLIDTGNPTVQRQLDLAMAYLGEAGEIRRAGQSDVYEIGVWDQDKIRAAQKANDAAHALANLRTARPHPLRASESMNAFEARTQTSSILFRVWEIADPPPIPSRPDIICFMIAGFDALFFTFGTLLLFNGFSRKSPSLLSTLAPAG